MVLASAGGTALVQAMATDTWAAVRDSVARVLGRGDERRESAVLQRLDASQAVVRGVTPERETAVRSVEEARWSGRIETLLEEHPDQAHELRALLGLIGSMLDGGAAEIRLTQNIHATGNAYVAGRDQYVEGRPARDSRD